MKILVSIIIPTYKRKENLLKLLKSLVPEMKQDYEVIIGKIKTGRCLRKK